MGKPGRSEAAHPRYAAPTQANRPIPSTVRRAVLFMRVGAGLTGANGLLAAVLSALGWHDRPPAVDSASPNVNSSAFEAGYIIGFAVWFLLPVGLWLWMAHANKAGESWARITGTVFFGISCFVGLGSFAVDAVSGAGLPAAWTLVPLLITGLNWIIGLFAMILLWNKKSAPHFAPKPMPYPASGPGYFHAAPLPNTTMEPTKPRDPAADPWRVPDGQA